MKNPASLIIIFMFCPSTFVIAQHSIYKPLKVDLGINTVFAMKQGTGGGNGLYINPMFNLTDRFSIGPRLETAIVKKDKVDLVTGILNNKIVNLSSYLIVMDYYLSKERIRFFIGLGSGLFKQRDSFMVLGLGSVDLSGNSKMSLGLMPRLGYNVGHFKMTVNYIMTGDLMYDYLGFTLGLEIGGGLR